MNHIETSYIMEPFGRNTAAAIASVVRHTIKLDGEQAVMLFLAAGRLILNQVAFQMAVNDVLDLAGNDKLINLVFNLSSLKQNMDTLKQKPIKYPLRRQASSN